MDDLCMLKQPGVCYCCSGGSNLFRKEGSSTIGHILTNDLTNLRSKIDQDVF